MCFMPCTSAFRDLGVFRDTDISRFASHFSVLQQLHGMRRSALIDINQ
jgi:hypothetical protein